ncbi:MAG: autotransporter outer membrane beta-barrel domain-containing protein [Deltaproteobacteria bacterium]|nr:autotransporter outer membrane beta-barrel domain-containing protein [Deltaproteobacteria bacterium]
MDTADLTDRGSGMAKVNVGIEGSSSPLMMGDEVILIDASAGGLTADQVTASADGTGMAGVTLQYEFGIRVESDRLIAKVTVGPSASTRAKPLSEGFLAGLALVGQGADLAGGQGTAEAVAAAERAGRRGTVDRTGPGVFAAIRGGKIRYDTGSHVDLESFSVMAGLSWGADFAPGRLTLGVFAEYGNGSYDTYNSFSDSAAMHGGGDVTHAGGGILGRMDFSEWRSGTFYAEAGFRAGHARTEFSSGDLRDASGRAASYDSSSPYFGMHAGFGRAQRLGDSAMLDVFAKCFWTRQEGDEVRLSTGDLVRFEDADSRRLRLGGRLTLALGIAASPYIGAAWEREFDGDARASANGYPMEAPSLRGGTGIGEIGVAFDPSESLPVSRDIGVQGYTGKREGVTGTFALKIEF